MTRCGQVLTSGGNIVAWILVFSLLMVSEATTASRDSRQVLMTPFNFNYNPFYDTPYGPFAVPKTVFPFDRPLLTLPPTGRNPFFENVHGPNFADSRAPSKPTDSRLLMLPLALGGSCKSRLVEPLLNRCCAQSNACPQRSETITLCSDVPSPLGGAAVSSATTGKIEGIGAKDSGCLAAVMAYPPNNKIQISCPVFNVTSPLNVMIIDPAVSYQAIEPYPIKKDILYTSAKRVVYLTSSLSNTEDKFTCIWKAIP